MRSTFVFVIIDQLGSADAQSFTEVSKELGAAVPRDTMVLPTVTETAHASMSVGGPPATHGIIGEEAYLGSRPPLVHRRVDDDVLQMGYGSGTPLVSALNPLGIEVLVVAGKLKVAQLFDPRPAAMPGGLGNNAARVTLVRTNAGYVLRMHDNAGNASDLRALPKGLNSQEIDLACIEVAEDLLSARSDVAQTLLVLALPYLDILGHHTARSDNEYKAAAVVLDRWLSSFIKKIRAKDKDVEVVVRGDHGCRSTNVAVWPDPETGEIRYATRAGKRGVLPIPSGVLDHQDGGSMAAIIFDGGTARFRVHAGMAKTVAAQVRKSWGQFVTDAVPKAQLRETLAARGLEDSDHENWGEVVAFAKRAVALCKWKWMSANHGDVRVPMGEHGTWEAMDRSVAYWGPQDPPTLLAQVRAFFQRVRSG